MYNRKQKHRKLFIHLFIQQILVENFYVSGTVSSDNTRYKMYMAWISRSQGTYSKGDGQDKYMYKKNFKGNQTVSHINITDSKGYRRSKLVISSGYRDGYQRMLQRRKFRRMDYFSKVTGKVRNNKDVNIRN